MTSIEVLEKWYSIQNVWNEDIFCSIPKKYRSHIPNVPNLDNFLSHCCLDTLRELLDRCRCDTTTASTVLTHCLSTGNIEKALVVLNTNIVPNNDIVVILSRIQDLRLLTQYKNIRPDLWNKINVSPMSMYNMCNNEDYLIKILSLCTDQEMIDLVVLCSSCPNNLLNILAQRVPSSWAYRTELYDMILRDVITYNVPLDIISILLDRGCIVFLSDIVSIMTTYPPSIQREDIFYKCLGILGLSEYDFLSNNMANSRRFFNLDSLYNKKSQKFCSRDSANDSTLYGNSLEDIVDMFCVTTQHGPNVRYVLDIREMRSMLDKDTYVHPYTREVLPTNSIRERYTFLVEKEIPMGVLVSSDMEDALSDTELDDTEFIQSMIERHDLHFYWNDILLILSVYGVETLQALDKNPNIIRFYTGSIPDTVLNLRKDLHDLLKRCV